MKGKRNSMNTKKLMSAALAALLLAGCSAGGTAGGDAAGTTETAAAENLKILSPTGAPSLSLLPIVLGGKNTVETVEGADLLQAALVNPDAEYDVIICPTNLGVKLASAGKTDYRLLDVVTWGNLYIIGSDESDLEAGHKVAAFGEQAVPGLVFKKTYSDIGADVSFAYQTGQETMAALLSGDADAALIAEPAATAAIAKGKEQGKEFKVISDVQKEWGENGFPMAGLFVNSKTYEENKAMITDLVNQMKEFTDGVNPDDASALIDALNQAGIEQFGVPSAEIIGKCWKRMNISIRDAAECKDDVAAFLKVFGVDNVDGAFAE
jgi:NitT/TauT family transport system substrate-binding protein